MKNSTKILFTGLVATGKTTYIAAMWYMLFHNRKSQLALGELTTEDEYLNIICEKWMSFEPVLRTPLKNSGEKVTINVVDKITGKTIELNIPDFSGETFRSHFDQREWTEEFKEILKDTSGVLLFVNPTQTNNMPKLVIREHELMRLFGEEPNNDGVIFEKYDPSHTPNQVKIVEELQFFEKYGDIESPLKIAIIISQWDDVDKAKENLPAPEQWLKHHLPLLYQYCKCNSSIFQVRVYGISAQGGDYRDREELAEKNHLERVFITDGNECNNDILKPIIWVTE